MADALCSACQQHTEITESCPHEHDDRCAFCGQVLCSHWDWASGKYVADA